MDCVIFDIDGTLADCGHRLHHVKHGKRDWDQFFATMAEDRPIASVHRLFRALEDQGETLLLCSGRPERYRQTTQEWLLDHDLTGYTSLYMRPDGDHRADHIVKRQILDGIRADGYEPWLVIDDRPSVVAMWREAGLCCLQAKSDADAPAVTGKLTVMVGPSGAGKTTWLQSDAARALGIHPAHVLSSDQIRADLCGDFRDQTKNDAVFEALHAQARARLSHGLPVVIDATNLRRKDRMGVADLASGGDVTYVVIDRPIEEKRRDGGWRLGLTSADGEPFDLIAKHDQTFRSQIKDILAGDYLPNVKVIDVRA
jgi:phosphoglycolate phosphatase-like HAD superfamily hydrolase